MRATGRTMFVLGFTVGFFATSILAFFLLVAYVAGTRSK